MAFIPRLKSVKLICKQACPHGTVASLESMTINLNGKIVLFPEFSKLG